MSNPEYVGQCCDGCGGHLYLDHAGEYYVARDHGTHWLNHSEANRAARAAGWYIADKDLCPECREKMEVPGANQ